jgi:hypothetical protein
MPPAQDCTNLREGKRSVPGQVASQEQGWAKELHNVLFLINGGKINGTWANVWSEDESKAPQTPFARIMHIRGERSGRDESKRLGQRHLRASLMLKGRMQSARPGRPRASAAWTARLGQAESPSRRSSRGPAGGEIWPRPGLMRPSAAPLPPKRRREGRVPRAAHRRLGGRGTGQGPITPTVLSSRVRAPRL